MKKMDRFNELLNCIAKYNKQFCIYAKKYFNSKEQNEKLEYFDKMHKKHYCKELKMLLIEKFNEKNIEHIETCLIWCFKNPFDEQISDNSIKELLLNNFYDDMINNPDIYTKKLIKTNEILNLAVSQINKFDNEQYMLFKKCIEQFNNLKY